MSLCERGGGSPDPAAPTALRLERQLAFLAETDRLKTVVRSTRLTDGSRAENSAEHSWHLALMAVLLGEHAPAGVDINHAVQLLLVHDLVEIDAGDTDCYDTAGYETKAAREAQAADRIFGLLPAAQAATLSALWREFEAGVTAEAMYANALDRLQPLLLVRHATYRDWALRAQTPDQVLARMAPVEQGAPGLWPVVIGIIEEAFATGRFGRTD